jgi:hypothetical protein
MGWLLSGVTRPYVFGGLVAVAMGVLGYHLYATAAAYRQGQADAKAAGHAKTLEKINDASKAAELARKCNLDPACLMRNDGHRRD